MIIGTLLHITEASSGGVLPMIANICNGMTDGFWIVVAYVKEFDIFADIEEYQDIFACCVCEEVAA